MLRKVQFLLFYTFALLVVPFYIGPELAKNAQINLERLLLIALCLMFFFNLGKKKFYIDFMLLYKNHSLFIIFFVGYFFWRGISAINSPNNVSIFLYIYELISNFIVFLVFYCFLFNKGMYSNFFSVVFLSTFFVFSFALLELVLGKNIFASLAPSDAGAAITSEAIVRGVVYRVKSVFEHPLTLGHFCVMVLPLVLFYKFAYNDSAKYQRFTLVSSILSMAVMTGSRMTMLCCTMIIVIYFLLEGPKIKFLENSKAKSIIFYIWPIIFSLPILAIGVVSFLSGRSSLDSYVRQAQVANGLQVIKMEPIFGFGQGPGGMLAIERFGTAMKLWAENAATIDNWFLSVLLASGYPGLFLFLMFNIFVFLDIYRNFKNRKKLSREQSSDYNIWLGLSISYMFGFLFMIILSIFTLHPFFYIVLAGVLYFSIKLKKGLNKNILGVYQV